MTAQDTLAFRLALHRGGYAPLPLHGKKPPMDGWSKLSSVSREEIDMWSRVWPDAINTGTLTKFVPTLDADILNEPAARAIEDLVREIYEEGGYVLVRIGKPPKRAFPFRTDEPFPKLQISFVPHNGGATEKLEFLGDGQQVVVAGIHPETRAAYRWFGGEPGTIAREDLPYIHAEQARELIERCADLLVTEFGYVRDGGGNRKSKSANGSRQQAEPPGPVDRNKIEAALAVIDSGPYDTWLQVGAALHHELGESGFALFDAWSARSPKYQPAECSKKWCDVRRLTEFSAGTIFYLADEADSGWRDRYAKPEETPPQDAAAATPATRIIPGPFVWRDPATVPPRKWLYRRHLIRKFVSATIGPGGGGKSKLSVTDVLAMVTGRNLCGHNIGEAKLRAWLWNLEDPAEEIERRIHAACLHFGISNADLGNRLFFNSGRDQPLMLATHSIGRGATIVRPVSDAVVAAIKDLRIDVLIVDPWVSCHRVPENDNGAIDLVVKEFGRIADAGNCAIDLYAHTRKLSGEEVSAESARGGKSLTDATRSARVMNRMSENEGLRAGVKNYRLHFRMFGDKLNLAPPADESDWYRIVDVALPNGDQVGVVEPWKWPSALDGVTVQDLLAVQRLVHADPAWREDMRAKKWAGKAVAEILKLDLDEDAQREKAKGCLAVWIKTGALTVAIERDEKRMDRSFVRVGTWAHP